MFTVLLSLLSFSLCSVSAQEACPLQYSCNNTNFNESLVEKYCKSHDSVMSGRCCILNETVIGLDLRYCGVKTLNISQHVFEQVEILDLRENDYEKLTSDELIYLLKLNYLILWRTRQCKMSSLRSRNCKMHLLSWSLWLQMLK
ncbi:unnamed protein product [Larinioides sclopetarius]|uniref:Uncharacterized protein n=1 Tax=Larinioides sclopetarius TaxID=280406 RepID=A0AAV1Z751_9ARAC